MYLNEFTGRGVRVAVVDSGVHALHPHVGGEQAGGVGGRGEQQREPEGEEEPGKHAVTNAPRAHDLSL